MAMNVNNWYFDPAQRYNDVIFPQNGRKMGEKDWDRYDRMAPQERGYADSEDKLSAEGKAVLEKLRKSYSGTNVEFAVAESADGAEAKYKLSNTNREYTVLLTNEEIEHMAWDVKYHSDMLQKMKDMRASLIETKNKDLAAAKNLASDEVMRVTLSANPYGPITRSTQIEKKGASAMPSYMAAPEPPHRDMPGAPRTPGAPRSHRAHRAQRPDPRPHGHKNKMRHMERKH